MTRAWGLQRQISSTAWVISSGRSRSSSHCSGYSEKASTARPSCLAVVSCAAHTSSTNRLCSSAVVSLSPASSTCTSAEIRSAPGVSRRRATNDSTYWESPITARSDRARSALVLNTKPISFAQR